MRVVDLGDVAEATVLRWFSEGAAEVLRHDTHQVGGAFLMSDGSWQWDELDDEDRARLDREGRFFQMALQSRVRDVVGRVLAHAVEGNRP